MATTLTGSGFSCSAKISKRASSSSSSSSNRCCIKMSISVEDKKKTFILQKSEEAFNAAKNLMPGGVNSPVRTFKSVGGQPIVSDSAKGS
ncbi:Glutamate-1-semialdehyde 2,1-aminomutase 1 [Cardamine amara subsp. amara]|uniref:Glutamate-1-semialdehyde 2,1-aminomutase 1 n=1 Tax=Cardamine amara subsp. amara TaxID=228776 RepID=A0ABD1BJG2_CARAN